MSLRSPAASLILARIAAVGPITFAEFMELALYGPSVGYYRSPNRISAKGDYFTSPSAHPAFGAFICIQLLEIWRLLGSPACFRIVEPGAGQGTLRRDIESYAFQIDRVFANAIDYIEVDRCGSDSGNLPTSPAAGCVLSNELLDAFPVHRFVIEDGKLRELYVSERSGKIVEIVGPPSTPLIECSLKSMIDILPNGFRGEVNLRLSEYARLASNVLNKGYVLTIDFGYTESQLYSPERGKGTLRCYYRHSISMNPLENVGDQDISSHIDLTALDRAMAKSGFCLLGMTSQRAFLYRLGFREFSNKLRRKIRIQNDIDANRMAMHELVKPGGLGSFSVVVHGRDVSCSKLTGLDPNSDGKIARGLSLPVLASGEEGRISLIDGRFPFRSSSRKDSLAYPE